MYPTLLSVGPFHFLNLYGCVAAGLGVIIVWIGADRWRAGVRPPVVLFWTIIALAVVGGGFYLSGVPLKLVKWGPLYVRAYGVTLMLAFAIGILLTVRRARQVGLEPVMITDMALLVIILAIIGSRAVFVALNWQSEGRSLAQAVRIWTGGLSFHGGLFGGLLGMLIYARLARVSFWKLTDLVAPIFPLCYAIAKVGCLLNGCCYGAPTHFLLGIRFPVDLVADPPLLSVTKGTAVHPVQLYDAGANLLVFLLFLWLKGKAAYSGQLTLWALAIYSAVRMDMEVFRTGYTARLLVGPFTQAQVASLAIIVLTILVSFLLRRRAAIGAKAK